MIDLILLVLTMHEEVFLDTKMLRCRSLTNVGEFDSYKEEDFTKTEVFQHFLKLFMF